MPGPSPASDSPENDLRAAEDAPAAADDSGTAEGTEERTEEGTEGIVASGRPRRRTWWVFALVAALFLALDQYTKVLAVDHLTGAADRQLVGEILQLRLVYNPGAAFGLGTQFTVAITVLAIIATIGVLIFSLRLRSVLWAVSLGLLLAGIDGNLADRLFREPQAFHGHVVDFLMLPNWPIFNVADICINLGAALALLQVFRGIGLDGEKVVDEDDQHDEPGQDQDDEVTAE